MTLPEVRVLLLSAPGREDVVMAWKRVQAKSWPEMPFPVDVEDRDTSTGWTARFAKRLRETRAAYLITMLDDALVSKPPAPSDLGNALAQFVADPRLAAVQFYGIHRPLLPSAVPGYGLHDDSPPLEKRTLLVPSMVRTKACLEIASGALKLMRPAQDMGWPGAYNFELYGGQASLGWKVMAPLGLHQDSPWVHVDAVHQGKWSPAAMWLFEKHGVDMDFSRRGTYRAGEDPYMEEWKLACGGP